MNERIKKIRKYFGLSQSEFAKRINKTSGFISLVENRRSSMSKDTIEAICSEFGIRPEWLINGRGKMFEKEKAAVDKTYVGDRVRMVRVKIGVTQAEFADHIGFSKNQICKVETGKIIPSNNMLQCISEKYDINNDWLMTGKGEMLADSSGKALVDDDLIKCLQSDPEMVRRLRKYFHLD